jgi:hypothetical protein
MQQEKQHQTVIKGVISIQQQATIVTIFILLSTISPIKDATPTPSSVQLDHLLMAHYWVLRLWNTFFVHAAKIPPKSSKEEPLADLPKSASEWASFYVSDDTYSRMRAAQHPLLTALQANNLVKGIGSDTFFYYLLYLEHQLEFHGYYLHCFPVLALMRMVACGFSPRAVTFPVLAYLHLIQHNICQKLHMEEQAKFWIELADGSALISIYFYFLNFFILTTSDEFQLRRTHAFYRNNYSGT